MIKLLRCEIERLILTANFSIFLQKMFLNFGMDNLRKYLKVSIHVSCRTVLSEADENEDGKISLDELTAWTQRAFRAVHKRETKDRLEKLDTNKDGKISWVEFQKNKEDIGGTNGSLPLPPYQLLHVFLNDLFELPVDEGPCKKNSPHLKGLVCRTLPSFSLEARSSSRLY